MAAADGPHARDDAARDRAVRVRLQARRPRSARMREAGDAVHARTPRTRSIVELPDEPLPAWADGERIAEVVENLLQNAMKYSPGGGEVRLAVRRERETASRQRERPRHRDRGRRTWPSCSGRSRGCTTARRAGSRASAWGCRSASASCAPTAAASRSRAARRGLDLQLHAAALRRRRRSRARRCSWSRPPTPGRAGTCGAPPRPLGFAVHEVQDGVEAVEAAARLRPAALVLERILPRLRADEVAERLPEQETTREVPILLLGAADGRGQGAVPRVPAAPARP